MVQAVQMVQVDQAVGAFRITAGFASNLLNCLNDLNALNGVTEGND
jgi:hypothetical protein